MAIISIPTSIGGVSIPGAALKGPLGKLFGNNNQIEVLSYPRDLQYNLLDMNKENHMVFLKYLRV
jgi:hypothetical protein